MTMQRPHHLITPLKHSSLHRGVLKHAPQQGDSIVWPCTPM
eukprot:CAMPEP_0114230780 /NCGR_PEP_ID=MMETSP0058-20121206/3663_1 /TAXON_ID=36894 /ORGANISM="Pyramimonas parkeae, CCMP726" /LENGTH=40 /DNA_ID= /DNA_START= /DNA_END= /DNA_ORIENTATION=